MSLIDKITSAGKSVARKTGLGLATLAAAASLSGNADAGVIEIHNLTTTPDVEITTWYAKNIEGATKGWDDSDAEFISSLNTNVLQIYSIVEGTPMQVDSRPVDTYGFPFDLSIKGSVDDATNILGYKITDATDLVQGQVKMWDLANPDVKYELNLNGDSHLVNLPNITGSNEVYANWYLQLRPFDENPIQDKPVSEPAALFGSALGLYALSKGMKRRE
jgi:hypothetical protein